jgi:hypothetical protein
MPLIRGEIRIKFINHLCYGQTCNSSIDHTPLVFKNLLSPLRHNVLIFLHELYKIFLKDNIFNIILQLFFGFNITELPILANQSKKINSLENHADI